MLRAVKIFILLSKYAGRNVITWVLIFQKLKKQTMKRFIAPSEISKAKAEASVGASQDASEIK